jgi:hypothetical protein
MADIPSTPADGNVKVVIVTTIANTLAPTAAELNAGSSVDISCYLTSDGWSPSLDEQVISDSRLCETETFEQPGRKSRTLTAQYIDNTNTALANAAKTALVPGTALFAVTRRGKAYDTAFAAADKVTVSPIKPGAYNELPPEANSVLKISQKLFVTGRTVEGTVA